MKKLLLTLLVLVGISISCNGQPRGMYDIIWDPGVGATSYLVFTWEGLDTTACPFVEDQDYKDSANDVSNLLIDSTANLTIKTQLLNNGRYIIAAVVTKNDAGTYSALTKSYALKKSTAPGKSGKVKVKNPKAP